MDKVAQERLIKNEIMFRDRNEQARRVISNLSNADKPIGFCCECSNAECHKRLFVTSAAYKRLHLHTSHFMILPGHESPEVEKIVKQADGYCVVEKFDL